MTDSTDGEHSTLLRPDPRRVLARPFMPGEWGTVSPVSRLATVIERVLAVDDGDVPAVLQQVRERFATRHHDLDAVLRRHGELIRATQDGLDGITNDRLALLGAYFTQEYAVEGAALTNPSLVLAPGADPTTSGEVDVVMSARAIGEGHISSIVFRTGTLTAAGEVHWDLLSGHLTAGDRTDPLFDREAFRRQLQAAGADHAVVETALRHLPQDFSMDQLETRLRALVAGKTLDAATHEMVRLAHRLAAANYVVEFDEAVPVGDRVLFPSGPTESRGMEDARFVRFTDDDGSVCYYATYTAYDGFTIRPQLIRTDDFSSFRVLTLHGVGDHTKGVALFPRRVGGRYVALVRPDLESVAVATTDDVRDWSGPATIAQRPGNRAWDIVQLGNNGSPIETEAGWLVITHGVGPMRRYVLGALLLDLDDPARPLGYLPDALLEPSEDLRDGYVPNVVYSCGAVVHAGNLVLPYGYADVGTAIATYRLDDVLERLTTEGRARLEAA